MTEDARPPLLTLPDICARYQVSDRRVRDIVRQHRVPILQPGRRWLFDAQAEMAFREACRLYPVAAIEPARDRVATSKAERAEYVRALALTSAEPFRRSQKAKK